MEGEGSIEGSIERFRGFIESENFGPDDDDAGSDISSVLQVPLIISQAPDRYGFLGGDLYTVESEPKLSKSVIRRRERKWIDMLGHWDQMVKKSFRHIKNRCRKGIPMAVRGRAWFYLCGAKNLKANDPSTYEDLLRQNGDENCIDDIRKDIHRQFPLHELFSDEAHGKIGQQDLFNVLKAHSIYNPEDGYCQAQAPLAAILLMHMPAEDAFWCLVSICKNYLRGYYSPEMRTLRLDADILNGLLKKFSPFVHKHLKKHEVEPVLYMTEWFLCVYTRTLPWASVLRVWDMFMCEGIKVVFRVGLVLLKFTLGREDIIKTCPSMYETLIKLKSPSKFAIEEQFLIYQITRPDVTNDQIRREHLKQAKKREKRERKENNIKN